MAGELFENGNDEQLPKFVPVIKLIEKMKRKAGWFKCTLTRGEPLVVNNDMLIDHALHVGMEILPQLHENVKADSASAQARESALRLISYRVRSEKEINTRLQQKGVRKEVVTKVVSDLKNLKLLDDSDFALRFVNDLLKRKPSGAFLVKQELRKKGISEEIIEEITNQVFSRTSPFELGTRCAEKWLRRHKRMPEEEQRSKLSQFLYQRGFTWPEIEEVLGEISESK